MYEIYQKYYERYGYKRMTAGLRKQGWIQRIGQAILTRSMSKEVVSAKQLVKDSLDMLRMSSFYGRDWKKVSIDEFMELLDNYIEIV